MATVSVKMMPPFTPHSLRLTPYVLALVLAGCAPTKVTIETSPKLGQYPVKTVVVLPFDALTTPQIAEVPGPEFFVPPGAKRSDISLPAVPKSPEGRKLAEDKDRPRLTVPPYAPEKVTQLFYGRLKNRQGILVISPSEAGRAVKALGSSVTGMAPEQLARQVAARLSADAAVIGRVLVYQERVGSKLGADPAIVGFEVKLIGADGTVLWTGNYYEKQRPMNEDFLGFVQRKGVFVTAAELAEYGVDRVLRKFPFGTPAPYADAEE
jgi:hypothetical protein